MAMIECSKCGKHVSDGSPYCPHCGEPVPRKPAPFETDPKAKRLGWMRAARNLFFVLALLCGLYWAAAVAVESIDLPRIVPLLTCLFSLAWAALAFMAAREETG